MYQVAQIDDGLQEKIFNDLKSSHQIDSLKVSYIQSAVKGLKAGKGGKNHYAVNIENSNYVVYFDMERDACTSRYCLFFEGCCYEFIVELFERKIEFTGSIDPELEESLREEAVKAMLVMSSKSEGRSIDDPYYY
jgi:hypothetical protein